MTLRNSIWIVLLMAAGVVAAAGCSRRSPTAPWPLIIDPIVFTDGFGAHVGFQAFGDSKYDALSIDNTEKHSGTASLKFTVPAPGDRYAGGAFVTSRARSLTSYNALSFWVKASRAVPLEVAGLGNDNTGTSKFEAKRTAIPITTSWSQVFVPIPLAAKLKAERGLFFIAEAPQNGAGLTLWIDDVQFVNNPTIINPRPALTAQTLLALVGTTLDLSGATKTTFSVGGTDLTVQHMPGYFSYASSAPAIAAVTNGVVRVLGTGTAVVSATLGAIAATGSIAVSAQLPPIGAAPTPVVPTANVVSLFSDAYVSRPVDSWRQFGTTGITVEDFRVSGNATKFYKNLNLGFVGIEFKANEIDATAMTHFHMDVWAPTGSNFHVKLVDFGPDGVFGGGNDTQHELVLDAGTTPPFTSGSWADLDIPLANFTLLTGRAHIAQLILLGDTPIALVDNIYFHK